MFGGIRAIIYKNENHAGFNNNWVFTEDINQVSTAVIFHRLQYDPSFYHQRSRPLLTAVKNAVLKALRTTIFYIVYDNTKMGMSIFRMSLMQCFQCDVNLINVWVLNYLELQKVQTDFWSFSYFLWERFLWGFCTWFCRETPSWSHTSRSLLLQGRCACI